MIARPDIFRDNFRGLIFFIIGARQEKTIFRLQLLKCFVEQGKKEGIRVMRQKHIGSISNQYDNLCSPIDRRFLLRLVFLLYCTNSVLFPSPYNEKI